MGWSSYGPAVSEGTRSTAPLARLLSAVPEHRGDNPVRGWPGTGHPWPPTEAPEARWRSAEQSEVDAFIS